LCPEEIGIAKPFYRDAGPPPTDHDLFEAAMYRAPADTAVRRIVYERTTHPGWYWLLVHQKTGYRPDGQRFRVIETQKYADGSPRFTVSGRGVGRRVTTEGILSQTVLGAYKDEADRDTTAAIKRGKTFDGKPIGDELKVISGDKLLLPTVVYCPKCGRPIAIDPPQDEDLVV
jgi:hypothetical protein